MSTKFRNTSMYAAYKRFICAVLACALVMSTFFTGDAIVMAQESEGVETAQIATETDADKSGLIAEEGGYRYYIDGTAVSKTGWITANDRELYIDENGYVSKEYFANEHQLNVYDGTQVAAASNIETVLSDGYDYLFDIHGVKVTEMGWVLAGNCKYYIDGNGSVKQKYTRTGDIIELYGDSTGQGNWELYTDTWMTIDGVKFYFSGTGVCTKFYFIDLQRAKVLGGDKFELASNQILSMDDGREYFFNAKGILTSKAGWYTSNNGQNIYVDSLGRVIGKVSRKGGVYRLYKVDSTGTSWNLQKKQWKDTNTFLYYFSNDGRATVVYSKSSKRLYKYSTKSKKYVAVKNELNKLNGRAYYFYNSRGVRVTSTGWKRANSKTYYYIGKKGYMKSKYVVSGAAKRLYDYNYSTNKWVAQKSKWRQVGGQKYYFNSKGVATVGYVTGIRRGYKLFKGKWVPIRCAIQKIGSSNYYFNNKGILVKKAGVYKTANGYLAYVNKRGVVYKREYNLEVKRYYTIDLGHGKTTKVYGYYDLGAAKRLMDEVNAHRNENGLSSLTVSSSMTETATTRAKEISNTYSHYRPNGTLCINSMYELFGENLAGGFSDESLAFRAWTKSTDHDRNMLDTSYKTLGAAVFVALSNDNEGYKRYYVLTFGK